MERELENTGQGDAPGDELEELFAFYVERLQRGEPCHPQEIIARHPAVAEQLLADLEDYVAPGDLGVIRTPGDYELCEEIGRGGMGVVYRARQNSLDREVALKILPLGIAADDRAFHRFMREAKMAARFHHENIVRVFGMGVEASTPYYAMELVMIHARSQAAFAVGSSSSHVRPMRGYPGVPSARGQRIPREGRARERRAAPFPGTGEKRPCGGRDHRGASSLRAIDGPSTRSDRPEPWDPFPPRSGGAAGTG